MDIRNVATRSPLLVLLLALGAAAACGHKRAPAESPTPSTSAASPAGSVVVTGDPSSGNFEMSGTIDLSQATAQPLTAYGYDTFAITFAKGTTKLTKDGKAALDQVATRAKASEVKGGWIRGFAGADEKKGDTLKVDRAALVKKTLLKKGVAAALFEPTIPAKTDFSMPNAIGNPEPSYRVEVTLGAELKMNPATTSDAGAQAL